MLLFSKLTRSKRGRIMITMSLILISLYAAVVGFMYGFQRHLMYFPSKDMREPSFYGLSEVSEKTFLTDDNVEITSWYRAPKNGNPILVYFHGNRGNLGDRANKFKTFLAHPVGFLAVSYRGYGSSEGEPSESGLYEDARTAVRFLMEQGIPLSRIVFYGESLGTGVAVQMALEFGGAKALVLEAPYTSVVRRAQEKYPFIPASHILKDHFNSAAKIKSIQMPVLIFHGRLDEVIPFVHGQELFSMANEPKENHWFENVHHTDFNANVLIDSVAEFIQRHPTKSPVYVH